MGNENTETDAQTLAEQHVCLWQPSNSETANAYLSCTFNIAGPKVAKVILFPLCQSCCYHNWCPYLSFFVRQSIVIFQNKVRWCSKCITPWNCSFHLKNLKIWKSFLHMHQIRLIMQYYISCCFHLYNFALQGVQSFLVSRWLLINLQFCFPFKMIKWS